MDFIGFTYNGYHSIRDLNIYRTSDGSRYNENLTATMTDKTADVPGGDGQYYFGTQFKNRTFNVSYAFDSLSESGLAKLKEVFRGDGIHELIFDETPYKAWSAKVTGTATLKHICFEENGERLYKGEGSITFTCYYPYAHTPLNLPKIDKIEEAKVPVNRKLSCDIFISGSREPDKDAKHWLQINSDRAIKLYYRVIENNKWSELKETTLEPSTPGNTKKFANTTLSYVEFVEIPQKSNEEFVDTGKIKLYIHESGSVFYYSVNGRFVNQACFNTGTTALDGRDINHYCSEIYTNKKEWAIASKMGCAPKTCENFGDLPAPFILRTEKDIVSGNRIQIRDENKKILFEITINQESNGLIWDSKTGIVKNTEGQLIQYKGDSIGMLPTGPNYIDTYIIYIENNTEKTTKITTSVKYQYWYR